MIPPSAEPKKPRGRPKGEVPKMAVTLYLPVETWEAYQRFCTDQELVPSHEIAQWMQDQLKSHRRSTAS